MKFIDLGSEASYNHKDFLPVIVERRKQSLLYSELSAKYTDFLVDEIVEAGWIDKEGRKFLSKVTKVREVENDFEDERTWHITIQRTKT